MVLVPQSETVATIKLGDAALDYVTRFARELSSITASQTFKDKLIYGLKACYTVPDAQFYYGFYLGEPNYSKLVAYPDNLVELECPLWQINRWKSVTDGDAANVYDVHYDIKPLNIQIARATGFILDPGLDDFRVYESGQFDVTGIEEIEGLPFLDEDGRIKRHSGWAKVTPAELGLDKWWASDLCQRWWSNIDSVKLPDFSTMEQRPFIWLEVVENLVKKNFDLWLATQPSLNTLQNPLKRSNEALENPVSKRIA
jgi:hypothetical protein